MSKETAPAFQFYPRDWLAGSGARLMTLEERGAYMDLLAHAWLDHGIPSDDAEIARLLQITKRQWTRLSIRVKPKFIIESHGKLQNDRQERERAKQAKHRDRASRGGHAKATKQAASKQPLSSRSAPAKTPALRCTASSSASASALQQRAGEFCRRYTALYREHREAVYVPTYLAETKDLDAAHRLCAVYTDPQLEELAELFLTIPEDRDPFMAGKTRTLTMLLSRATVMAERLGIKASPKEADGSAA